MSAGSVNTFDEKGKQSIAAEVLELGKCLFEIALEAGNYQSAGNQQGEEYSIEEIRTTSGEFFTALQLLLRIEE